MLFLSRPLAVLILGFPLSIIKGMMKLAMNEHGIFC
jgi:hypothetical protein